MYHVPNQSLRRQYTSNTVFSFLSQSSIGPFRTSFSKRSQTLRRTLPRNPQYMYTISKCRARNSKSVQIFPRSPPNAYVFSPLYVPGLKASSFVAEAECTIVTNPGFPPSFSSSSSLSCLYKGKVQRTYCETENGARKNVRIRLATNDVKGAAALKAVWNRVDLVAILKSFQLALASFILTE